MKQEQGKHSPLLIFHLGFARSQLLVRVVRVISWIVLILGPSKQSAK